MLKPSQLVYVVLEVLMAVLAVLGNVLVCWAVCLNSNLQTVTNLFVVSLAVADVAVGLLAIPFAIIISTGICAQFFGCLFITCFVLILTQSSIFSLLAIAVDRYVAITNPLRYSSLVTGRRAKLIIALCWLLSFGIGLTPMLGWNNGPNATAPTGTSSCPEGLTECLFEGVVTMDYMIYFNFFCCVLLPLLFMLIIYVHIFLAARRQLLQMGPKVAPAPPESSSSSRCSQSTLKKEVHAAKSLAIIVGFFALCWLPVHVINCFNYLCHRCERAHVWLINTAIILSHANSVVNPFIYAYRIGEFRQTFRRILYQQVLGRRDGATSGPRGGEDPAAANRSITRSPSGSKEGSLCSTVVSSSFLDSVSDRVAAADPCRWTPAEDAAPRHPGPAHSPPRSARHTCTVGFAEPHVPPNLQGSVEGWEGPSSDLREGPSSDLRGSVEGWEGPSSDLREGPSSDLQGSVEGWEGPSSDLREGPSSDLQGSVEGWEGPSSDLREGPSSDLQGSVEGWEGPSSDLREGPSSSSRVTVVRVKRSNRVCSTSLTDVS